MALCLAAPAAAVPPSLSLPEEPADTPKKQEVPRFIVMPLDDTTSTQDLEYQIGGFLLQSGYKVIGSEWIDDELARRVMPPMDQVLLNKFLDMMGKLPNSINLYFYGEEKNALKSFSMVMNFIVEHPEALIRRPDFSEAAYEAGILLARLYDQSPSTHKERDVAVAVMARAFPSMLPSSKTVPPEIRELFRLERERIAEEGTELTLIAPDASVERKCELTLNGLPAISGQTYGVEAGREYLLRADCGKANSPTWRWTATEGSTELPLVDVFPSSLDLKDASTTERRHAEELLSFALAWITADTLIGVSHRDPQNPKGSVLFVRLDPGQSPLWSDSAENKVLATALPRLLPDYPLLTHASSLNDASSAQTSKRPSLGERIGPSGFTLGAGVLLLSFGTFSTVRGARQLYRYDCSPSNPNYEADRCQDIDGYSDQELGENEEDRSAQLIAYYDQGILRRNVGIGLLIGGALTLAGGALWRRAETKRDAQIALHLTSNHATADLTLRF